LTVRGPVSLLREVARELSRVVARAVREPVVWLVALGLALGPRLVTSWSSRRRRRRAAALETSAAVSAELRALVREVERRWSALGRPRPPGRGLLEHARAVAGEGAFGAAVPAGMAAAARDVVDAYYRARFGDEPPDPAETARLRHDLREA
jgi:hypothetical protein